MSDYEPVSLVSGTNLGGSVINHSRIVYAKKDRTLITGLIGYVLPNEVYYEKDQIKGDISQEAKDLILKSKECFF